MYAKIVNGAALYVVPATSCGDVGRFFHQDWIQSNGGCESWTEVPEGTKHGAISNGDGTFNNPSEQSPAPVSMTKSQWQALRAANDGDADAAEENWPEA